MPTLVRLVAVISVFAIAAPPIGTAVLLAIAAISGPQLSGGSYSGDLVSSISEFGHFAALAGLVFAAVAYFALGRLGFLSRVGGRAALGGAAMLLVFGSMVLHKLLVYGSFSAVLALIASLAVLAGAVVGGTYPARLLAAKHRNAG